MKRLALLAMGLGLVVGCAQGTPEPSDVDPVEAAAQSGADALAPGVDREAAAEAVRQFYETGEVSPELRKKLESGENYYGEQYPGARKGAPPQ